MQIAFVGKGGSGKSSLSWLMVNYLASLGKQVLAIDADHNMDLAANLGFEVKNDSKAIYSSHELFRKLVGLKSDEKWSELLKKEISYRFSFPKKDEYTNQLAYPISKNIELIIVGLGKEDLLFSNKCSHGHSAPLKYYLPLLDLDQNAHVIIDGVAGTDMLNYGLFIGCDLCIISVENHPNSQRVADKILEINKTLATPTFVVLNKYMDNEAHKALENKYGSLILAKIPVDLSILNSEFLTLSKELVGSLDQLWSNIQSLKLESVDKWKLSKEFQDKKNDKRNLRS